MQSLIGEFIGSWVLCGMGLMALAVSVTTGTLNYFEAIFIFVFIVGLAVIYVAPLSGAHINPAVTLALAVFSGFPKKHILPYWVAQILGGFVGGLTVYLFFGSAITALEKSMGIVRGTPESQLTAMIFCGYAPHPWIAKNMGWDASIVPIWKAILSEVVGTGLLVLSVFSFNDEENPLGPRHGLFGAMIAIVLLVYVGIFAPLSMGIVNPARDFGPRLAAAFLGWGPVAIPGLGSGVGGPFWMYWVGPLIGGVLGAGLWVKVAKPIIQAHKEDEAALEEVTEDGRYQRHD
jgi:glycerol uptake facilitator protein